MSILIRKIRSSGSTIVETTDMEFEADQLSLGSAASCDVQLFGEEVAPNHLRLRAEAGEVQFECLGKALVELAGEARRSGRIGLGEGFSISGNLVQVIDAPPGFELALELTVETAEELSSRSRLSSELNAAVPSIRWTSYLLAILVIVLGLALPIYAYWQQPTQTSWQRADKVWDTGPLIRAHQTPAIGDDCGVCHADAFTPVQDETCLGCHQTIKHHHAGQAGFAFDDGSCMACHREHSEPETILISGGQLCASCHEGELHSELAEHSIAAASGFSEKTHPKFSLSMLQFNSKDHHWVKRRVAATDLVGEDSNLQFPHDLHLNPEKVSDDSNEGLSCNACHSLQDGGEHFEPISMEMQCSSCHTLGLDVRFPERRVPHSEPSVVRHYLEEYHTTRYARLLGNESANRGVAPPRTGEARVREDCEFGDDIAECGIDLANKEMRRLFETSGCIECHQIEEQQIKNRSTWTVFPVRLTADWYPNNAFNHKPHLQLGASTVDASCLSCHEADVSSKSSDVLMPGLDNCLQCHADDKKKSVVLDCHACHDFHRATLPVMTPSATERVFWQEFKRKVGVGL